MLFKILKLFGLDVPAQIEAVKANLEHRLELATHHVSQVAQRAAIVAALATFALIAGLMAVAVGLIALYVGVANQYGVYAGLGAVGGLLVVASAMLIAVAIVEGKSIMPERIEQPDTAAPATNAVADATDPWANPAAMPVMPAPPVAPVNSAADLVEPLALFLSRFVKYPTLDNPVMDELIGNLRGSAQGTVHDAIDRATNVVRTGDRTNLMLVLSGAGFIGWLLARQARQQ
jgi:hypothetical protein